MLKSTLARMREARMQEVEGEGVAEAGFTLIELMVVLLIIAILLAIAIPTFLGVTSSARDRAVQSNLTNAMTEVQAQYQNTQDYSYAAQGAGQPTLNQSAPEFQWQDGNVVSAAQNQMSVLPIQVASANDNQGIVIAVLNKQTGKCWYSMNLQGNPVNGIFADFAKVTRAGTYYANQQTAAGPPAVTCQASNGAAAGFNWGTSYSDAAGNN